MEGVLIYRSSRCCFLGVIKCMWGQMALFTAGIVLLLNIWGGKRSGLSTDPAKEMADVHKCMKMLRTLEPRCVVSRLCGDLLFWLTPISEPF